MTTTITINMDKPCSRCGKPGATGTGEKGWCLKCIAKWMREGRFDHLINKPAEEAKP